MRVFLVIFSLFLSSIAPPEPAEKLTTRSGNIYAELLVDGIQKSAPLYSMRFEEYDSTDGRPLRATAESLDSNGQSTSRMEVQFKDGVPVSLTSVRPDLNASARVIADAKKIHIEREIDGKKEMAEEDQEDSPLVLGPDMGRFLRGRLRELRENNELRFRMLALSRMRTFEFRAQRIDTGTLEQERTGKWIHVKISLTHVLYSALAKPLHVWLDARTGALKIYQGQVESREPGKSHLFEAVARYDLPLR